MSTPARLCYRSSFTWRSTAVVFALTTAANLTFSVVGGLLLYLESLREIERGVEEISESEINAHISKLNRSFADVLWTSQHSGDHILLNGTAGAGTYEDVLQVYWSSQLSQLLSSDTLYSLALIVAPLEQHRAEDGLALLTWWDPLTVGEDAGTRQWVHARYVPEYYGSEGCRPETGEYTPRMKRCAVAEEVFPEAPSTPPRFLYNYSEFNLWALQSGEWDASLDGWEEGGASFWRQLDYWSSVDGTTYSYATHVRVLPLVHVPPFRDAKVAVNTYISFFRWLERIDNVTKTLMVVVAHTEHNNGTVLATNLANYSLQRRGCQAQTLRETGHFGSFDNCTVRIADLPHSAREGAAFLFDKPFDRFLTAELHGEAHWARRGSIFKPQKNDLLVPIDLLWMRKQSTVHNDVKGALNDFVYFVVGAAVLSTIVLTLLVVGISIPLGKVADAMRHLDAMELEKAEAELPTRQVQVTEVSMLVRSVRTSLVSLKMFRDFLPRSCLELGEEEGADEEPSDGAKGIPDGDTTATGSGIPAAVMATSQSLHSLGPPSRRTSHCSSGASGSPRPARSTSLQSLVNAELEHRVVSVATVNVVGTLDEVSHQRHKGLLSLLTQCRADGVLDGCFGDRCRVSWNGSRAVCSQRVRAATFAETMRGCRFQGGRQPLDPPAHPLLLSVAATSGKAKCGFTGCDGTRFYTMIGRHVSLAFVLERAACAEARRRGVSVAIVPRNVQEDAATAVRCRFLMLVRWQKLTADTALYETVDLVPDSADTAEEWMYIVSRLDRASVWGIYNDAALLLSTGSAAEARQRLRERAVGSDAGVEVLYSELVSAADGGSCGFRTRELCDDPVRIPAADVVERV